MKKSFIAVLVLAIFCFASLASAAADPFSDVPAKHWAYSAVNQLAKAGVINGYGDGTFRGDRTMTRYEMAMIVANAMTKEDKADKETRALIDKLAIEFGSELKSLGKRVEALEKNQSRLKLDGFFQERTEWLKAPLAHTNDAFADTNRHVMQRTAMWLNVSNQFDADTYFHGVIWTENFPAVQSQNTYLQFHEGFVAHKIGESTELAAGMFFPTLGKGTIMSTPMMQGARLSYAPNSDIKLNVYSVTFNVDFADSYYATYDTSGNVTGSAYFGPASLAANNGGFADGGIHYDMGDLTINMGKNADLTFAVVQDKGIHMGPFGSIYRQYAIGGEYRGMENLTLTAEFAKNNSDIAKAGNNGSAANAKFVKLKYKGANPFAPGSTGLYVQYKKADPNFDILANAGPMTWNSVFNYTAGAGGGQADNIKGFEYGFETTVAPRLIFSAQYDHLKYVTKPTAISDDNRSFFTAQFWYLF